MNVPRMTATESDFDALYRDLGITAQCALPVFKQRYRRRVAQLHPDHGGNARDAEALKLLNQRYSAALAFHRRHGRFPGAAGDAAIAWAMPVRAAGSGPSPATRRPTMRTWALLALFAATALAVWIKLTWTVPDHAADLQSGSAATAIQVPASGGMRSVGKAGNWMPARLRPGMSPAKVREQLGEPISRGDDARLWIYGPSWLRFECGQLVEWYSSPLAPLRTQVVAIEDGATGSAPPRPRCASADVGNASGTGSTGATR